MDLHQRLFSQELERVRLRAMLAVERAAAKPDTEVTARISGELAALEAGLVVPRKTSRAHDLAQRLDLDDDELDLLWTTVALTADPRLHPHAMVLGGADARRGLTLANYVQLSQISGERARSLSQRLLATSSLMRDHILEWVDGDATASIARPLIAPTRTVSWLAGLDMVDGSMLGAGTVVPVLGELELDATQCAVAARLPDMLRGLPAPLIVVEGASGTGRRTMIAWAANAVGRELVALDLRRLPHGHAALETALVGLRRECRLRDAIPAILDLNEVSGDAASVTLRMLARVIDELPGPVVATTNQHNVEVPVSRALVRAHWKTPDVPTRAALWRRMLGTEAPAVARCLDEVAMRYSLGAGGISRAVCTSRLIANHGPVTPHELIEGVRTNIAEKLGELAERTEVRQSWDELVLAPDIHDQVKMLVSRVRHSRRVLEDWGMSSKLPKGTGVAALFSGPPGTGKTMVAGLIARELDLELYQVDLSKVVSKWVGETEKQLAKIFEAAEAGHALLLFDEADALFAKRTEVKSSNDRYANLEVNYLLQRIESFGGVSILTTNLDASIDPALRRRLAAMVTFWPPDDEERQRLWQRMLNARAPIARDIDLEALSAKYDKMTGANIRNAVLAAAFLAAAEETPITHACLDRAARAEYASMGRVIGRK